MRSPRIASRQTDPQEIVLRLSLPLAAAGLMLPMAVFASKAMAPLFAAAALAMLAGHILDKRSFPPIPPRIGATLGMVLIYAATSAAWSLTPERTVAASVPFAGLLLGVAWLLGSAHRLDEEERMRVRSFLLIGVAVGLGLLAIERAFERPLMRAWIALFGWGGNPDLFTLKPAATIAAVLAWPFLLALRQRASRVATLAAAAALFAVVALVGAGAAILGLVLGGAVFFLARRWRRVMGPLLGVALAVFMTGAPWIPSLFPDPRVSMRGIEYLPNSAVHRLYIWQTTVGHIHERPWLGHGFDTARSLYPQQTAITVSLAKPTFGNLSEIIGEPIPLHPHNMALQIWLEMGALGAGLTLVVLLAALAALARMPLGKTERAAGYGFFVTTLTIAAVAYGAWQAWWLAALGLGATFLVVSFAGVTTGGSKTMSHPSRIPEKTGSAPAPSAPPFGEVAEIGGPRGRDPTRYGDWEKSGRAIDF
jgi:exopolysaccharide production protein ExoQ